MRMTRMAEVGVGERTAERHTPEALMLRPLDGHEDAPTASKALRAIKNAVIGNRHKKLAFLAANAVDVVTKAAQRRDELDVRIQAAAVLASLAHGHTQGASQMRESGVVPLLLLPMVASDCLPAVEAAARALRMLCQVLEHPPPPSPSQCATKPFRTICTRFYT
jgi:hypothetical protein